MVTGVAVAADSLESDDVDDALGIALGIALETLPSALMLLIQGHVLAATTDLRAVSSTGEGATRGTMRCRTAAIIKG